MTSRSRPGSHLCPSDKVIGLKVNGLGGKGISTHAALIMAVAERLQQAGVKPGNIVVWDRNARDPRGLRPDHQHRSQPRPLLSASDVAGFEDEQSACGVGATFELTKILTRECAMVINLPILKDHSMAGVTFAMKNMYGVVEQPFELCTRTTAIPAWPT